VERLEISSSKPTSKNEQIIPIGSTHPGNHQAGENGLNKDGTRVCISVINFVCFLLSATGKSTVEEEAYKLVGCGFKHLSQI